MNYVPANPDFRHNKKRKVINNVVCPQWSNMICLILNANVQCENSVVTRHTRHVMLCVLPVGFISLD
jgi:hypothetical protein